MIDQFSSSKRIISLLLLSITLSLGSVFASTPSFINYQGYITNSSGVAQSGSAPITIRIYDSQTGGNLLFEENEEIGRAHV